MKSFGLVLALVVIAYGTHDPAKEAKEYPYIVSIHTKLLRRNFIGAGSLIAPSWVLTTAHCLTKIAYKIRYGDMITNNGTYSTILQRIHHRSSRSQYHLKGVKRLTPKTNNIGLAMIESVVDRPVARLGSIDYTTLIGCQVAYFEYGFLPVFKAKIYQSNKGRLKGHTKRPWAKMKEALGNYSDVALPPEIKVLVVGSGISVRCNREDRPGPKICVVNKCFRYEDIDDPGMIHVVPDYGAPLVHDKMVVGVTAEVETQYSIFTPLSPYLSWIRKHLDREESY